MSTGSSRVDFPVQICNATSFISEGLVQTLEEFALLVLPVNHDLLLVLITRYYALMQVVNLSKITVVRNSSSSSFE